MSRVGRKSIEVPSGVKIELAGKKVKVEAKGKHLELDIPEGFKVEVKGSKIGVIRPSDSLKNRALHGTVRSLLMNMVTGLTAGFQKKLEIQGVGYKAQMKGKTLVLDIGFTHSVEVPTPDGITIKTPTPIEIIVEGADKQKVGAVAAEIRGHYPPEPYKGKGIRYHGEYVRQKQGKSIA